MMAIAAALTYCTGMVVAAYMLLEGHPWFSAFVLIGAFSTTWKGTPKKDEVKS